MVPGSYVQRRLNKFNKHISSFHVGARESIMSKSVLTTTERSTCVCVNSKNIFRVILGSFYQHLTVSTHPHVVSLESSDVCVRQSSRGVRPLGNYLATE